jgi:hypothetical protein
MKMMMQNHKNKEGCGCKKSMKDGKDGKDSHHNEEGENAGNDHGSMEDM